MDFAEFLIDPQRLWTGDSIHEIPMAIVDCEAARHWPEHVSLPPCPVIGLGDRDHPLAAMLDTVVEAPIVLERLVASITARPRAAAVVTDLLRILPGLAPEAGLVAESLAYATLQGGGEHHAWLAAQRSRDAGAPGRLFMSRDGERLHLQLDRTQAGNAIDCWLRDALTEGFALAGADCTIERVCLTARGRCFSLGAELAEFGTMRDPAAAHGIRRRTLPARHALAVADRMEAWVQGACVGAGLEIAAFSHRIVAAPDAWFQLPELAMGILPGAGGCVSIMRRIGAQRTALMILSGRRISARVALDWGLVDEIASDDGGAHVF